MLYILCNKIVYLSLLLINLYFLAFDITKGSYKFNEYIFFLSPILIALNTYHLALVIKRKLKPWNYKAEIIISLCRMIMIFFAGTPLVLAFVILSPVANSFWFPLLDLLDFLLKTFPNSSLSLLIMYSLGFFFLLIEFYNLYLLRRNRDELRRNLE